MTGRNVPPLLLWLLLAATLAMTAGFALIQSIGDFVLLDRIADPVGVRTTLDRYTPGQTSLHIWTTATLDVLYPLCYGALFALMPLQFFPRGQFVLAAPALLGIPVDLAEGAVQLAALTGHDQLIFLKAYLTPLKAGLFALAALIALSAVCYGLYTPRSNAD